MKFDRLRKYGLGLVLAVVAPYAFGQVTASTRPVPSTDTPVKWYTFEEAVEKNKTEKRTLFIDVYTDWCGWCKVMDKNTFSEPRIAKLLNEKFYPVKLNAEQQEDIVFNGTTFKYVGAGGRGTHQLAMALLNNQPSYPTVVFLNETYTSAFPIPGYRQPPEFHKYLAFFGEGYDKKGETAWKDFEKVYKSPYSESEGK